MLYRRQLNASTLSLDCTGTARHGGFGFPAIPGLQEGHVVQTLARQSVSVLDFAEDDVIFCTGNMAVASYSIMQGELNGKPADFMVV
jgi:hypothetical protein